MDEQVLKAIARHDRKTHFTKYVKEVNNTVLETLLKTILVVVILVATYYLAQWVVLALGLPAILITLIAIFLGGVFILWFIRAFGISL